MDESIVARNSSRGIAFISLVLSFVTLFLAYLKPQFFDKPKIIIQTTKELKVKILFGDLQLFKNFSLINTGQKEGVVNDIQAYILTEGKTDISKFEDVSSRVIAGYVMNDGKDRYDVLDGFTVFANNGFSNEILFANRLSRPHRKELQDIEDSCEVIRESIRNYKTKISINIPDSWRGDDIEKKDRRIINNLEQLNDLKEAVSSKIIRKQSALEEKLSIGTHYLCEKISLAGGATYYHVYSFEISNEDFKEIEDLRQGYFLSKFSTNYTSMIYVDLRHVGKEIYKNIIAKVKEFDARIN